MHMNYAYTLPDVFLLRLLRQRQGICSFTEWGALTKLSVGGGEVQAIVYYRLQSVGLWTSADSLASTDLFPACIRRAGQFFVISHLPDSDLCVVVCEHSCANNYYM